jgi:NADPH:quinone reductase-like Zn-dependent oxidoreductase
VPKPFHIIGVDGAGVVIDAGPDCKYFKPGDEVFYGSVPVRQGSAAERQLVDERMVGHKPSTFDFVESAALPVTYGTAYEALIERLGIQKGEQAAVLIINGAGGVGSMASQLARHVLELPVVITTASRPETIEWTQKMGATHVLNHHDDLRPQVTALNLQVPLKYVMADQCSQLVDVSDLLADTYSSFTPRRSTCQYAPISAPL